MASSGLPVANINNRRSKQMDKKERGVFQMSSTR